MYDLVFCLAKIPRFTFGRLSSLNPKTLYQLLFQPPLVARRQEHTFFLFHASVLVGGLSDF